MSDQTPRVPDFWWSSRNGLLARKYPEDQYFRLTYGYTTGPMPDLPADAVKLGDVEGHVNAQRTAEERCTRVARELDNLRADIREVVQESWVRPRMTVVALDRIRAIVDREPVREAPRCTLTVDGNRCNKPADHIEHVCTPPAAAPAEPGEDTVPCGRDDEDCSLRGGGSAHCGGCRG